MARTYARIQEGRVAEVFTTQGDLEQLFNSALVWVDVTDQPGVAEGWLTDGEKFTAPVPVSAPHGPSLAELQEQLRTLGAKIALLTPTEP